METNQDAKRDDEVIDVGTDRGLFHTLFDFDTMRVAMKMRAICILRLESPDFSVQNA